MIFLPEHCKAIIEGKKTQTRRLCKSGDNFWRGQVRRTSNRHPTIGKLIWEPGREYAVCPGRGKSGIAKFQLLDIRRQRVQDISIEDAEAEGIEINFIHEGSDMYYSPAAQKMLTENHWQFDEIPDREKLQGSYGAFAMIWDRLHKNVNNWLENPWVWALTFELAR